MACDMAVKSVTSVFFFKNTHSLSTLCIILRIRRVMNMLCYMNENMFSLQRLLQQFKISHYFLNSLLVSFVASVMFLGKFCEKFHWLIIKTF